jgi:hypothetical protein
MEALGTNGVIAALFSTSVTKTINIAESGRRIQCNES